jgi:glycosyltransferase involved in cell wall biosynthesis
VIIAVDTRFTKAYRQFIYQCIKIIASKQPQHSFILISEKPSEPLFNSENIIFEIAKRAKISLLQQVQVSSILKKYKADVFVTGQAVNTTIPQCVIAIDGPISRSLKKANVVVAGSEFLRRRIIEEFKVDNTDINVIYEGIDEMFQPIRPGQKEQVKEGYADGHEYFLSIVSSNDGLLNLLKAFSVFKKMQKSNMQLLVVFPKDMNAELGETLRLYKFKSEVKVVNADPKELALVTAAAYAFVYLLSNYQHALNAMHTEVPVLVSNKEPLQEIAGDAAVYFNSNDHKDIAGKMMLVYKDENLRQQLIEKGREQVEKYAWENSAELLWNSIQKAAN